MANTPYPPEIREELLERFANGEFLTEIAKDDHMPSARAIRKWANAGDEYAAEIQAAREVGFEVETERLVEEIRNCDDPQKARVLSETLRWRIGKLSQVFRDRGPVLGVQVNVGDDRAFEAFAGALEEARARTASIADKTARVAVEGPPGADNAAGGLAGVDTSRGEGLREDPDGG